jgi:hAT family C-terminal dimerisation region
MLSYLTYFLLLLPLVLASHTQVSAFPAHCATRFGVLVEIAQVVLENKAAIKAAAYDDDLDALIATTSSAALFGKPAVGPGSSSFWQRLQSVVKLLQPARDAIHQLEGDQAMLSQLRTTWRELHKHFGAWHAQQKDEQLLADQVPTVFKARLEKSLHAAALVAYVLDPINFTTSSSHSTDGSWSTPQLTQQEEQTALKLLYRLLDANTTAAQKVISTEWSSFKLAGIAKKQAADLDYLTDKEQQGAKVIIKPIQQRLNWWGGQEQNKAWPKLAIAARRLLPRHVTSCAAERNWSKWGLLYTKLRNRMSLERASKLIFIAGNKGCLKASQPDHAVVMRMLAHEEVVEVE